MKIMLPFAMLALVACGAESPGVPDISPDELLAGPPAGAVVLDVRTAEEFASGHVPGAVNIPHDVLASRLGEIGVASDAPVVVYCERGGRAGMAADVLLDDGYTDVRHLAGDMSEWRSQQRPVETAAEAAESAGGSSP
jgi:rhodanese-related sulfurtransferase